MNKIITFYDTTLNEGILLEYDDYKTLQNNIGGYFQFFQSGNCTVYFDRSGILKQLPLNENINVYMIHGPIIIVYDNRFND